MAALAIAYTLSVGFAVYTASLGYGSTWSHMTQAEARYMMGAPTAGGEADKDWHYDERGSLFHLRFDGTGRLISSVCSEQGVAEQSCPDVLGIRVGTNERDLVLRLGAPERASFEGADKVMHYPGLGVIFRLRRGYVISVQHNVAHFSPGLIGKALWAMVP